MKVMNNMKTVISGSIVVYNPITEVKQWAEDNLVLNNPVYVNLIKRGQQETIARKHVQP